MNTNETNTEIEKYETAIFELIPAMEHGAGFVQEDTLNTPNPIRIIHPKNRVIMNTSVVFKPSIKDPKRTIEAPIRFIHGQEEIDKVKQDEDKMTTNNVLDKIVFINGLITVPNHGAYCGLYNFLMNHAQNESNTKRVKRLQPIFRELKPVKDAHDSNIRDLQLAEAMGWISKLVTQKGSEYTYQEEEIDLMATSFNVYAETPEEKFKALVHIAKTDPAMFLDTAKKGQQTVLIEIKHAIALKVISLEGSAASYTEGEMPLIKKFSNAVNTDEKKAMALGAFFTKTEGAEAYEIFKAKLATAKELATA